MIVIDNILISDDIIERQFVCNLKACKGACCVLGDGGAPLEKEEAELLPQLYDKIKPYLLPEGIKAIEEQGCTISTKTKDGYPKLRTPLVDNKACVYVNYSDDGTTLCGIELAYRDNKISFLKPISCHLYPIRVKELKQQEITNVNYDEWEICDDACQLGEKLKVPVFEFLKAPIIRKWGEDFYDTLKATAEYMAVQNKNGKK